jgi:hypothetical protein
LKLHGGYTYVGEFVRGTRSGWSKITYANGATYVGKIEDELVSDSLLPGCDLTSPSARYFLAC